jgi:hypothetical protein
MNKITETANDQIIDALALALHRDELELTPERIDALADTLTANAFRRLLNALNVCLMHHTPLDECADAERECCTEELTHW